MHRTLYKLPLFFLFSLVVFNNLWAQPACLGTQGQLKWLLWENVTDDELDDLTHLQAFPNNPDVHEIVTGLKSLGTVTEVTVEGNIYESAQYGTYYGSMIRGYLTVPQSGNYSFNVTGDDEVDFLLSTDDTRANITLQASISTWTYRKEFAKAEETNQTSVNIALTAEVYYYFEIRHKEHSGGDHFEVLWKTPTNTATWEDIPSINLYDYACACPATGTACDDGNANTTNDQEDGFCNCVGTPTNLPACIGTLGEIKALYYLEIPGNSMSSFLAAEKYPLMPDTAEILERIQGPLTGDERDTFGTKIAGFLKVPITGAYQFNVTCDDRASFALSTNDSPDNLVELSYSNWSSEHEHDRYAEQLQPAVILNKDNFYYFEMHHREGSGGDRFSAFWRTPFTQDTLWRYIDKTYIYGYGCEMACTPEGTPCDDNNNFTKDDKYDADCNCIGTPCRDCDETTALDYTPTEVCGVSDKADNTAENAWESCTPQAHPTSGRGLSHWIQYDLGKTYLLTESHVWNYNAAGATGKGFKDVVIDYSLDGTNWIQLGDIFQWQQASGAIGYEGTVGPNFNGISARYILITALNNWDNGLCSGLSKITINATDCLLMGQSCDDGDPNSVNDLYDEHCNCMGEGEGFSPCGTTELAQSNIVLSKSEYRAVARIQSSGMVQNGGNVKLIAGESVTLMNGFHAEAGSTFLAAIGNCEAVFTAKENTEPVVFSRTTENEDAIAAERPLTVATSPDLAFDDLGIISLKVWPNPTNSWTSLHFNLPKETVASLCVYSTDGRKIICLADEHTFLEGTYTKGFPAQRLTAGMYYVVLKTGTAVLTESLVVIE